MKLAMPWSARREKPIGSVHLIGKEYGLQRVCSVLSIISVECQAHGIAYLRMIKTKGRRKANKKMAFRNNCVLGENLRKIMSTPM